MKEFFIGEVLKKRRIELGLTQEQVSYGVCESSTLSRIENGSQTPCRSKLTALLQRLGLPEDRYYALTDKNELAILNLQTQLVSCQMRYKFREGLEKLSEYKASIPSDDILAQQFYLSSKAVFGRWENGQNVPFPFEEKLELLFDALRLTIPRFNIDDIESGLYSIDELKIFNQIALTYSDAGHRNISIHLYYQLLNYIQEHFHELSHFLPVTILIIYNYSRDLCLENRVNEALELADRGLQLSRQTGYAAYLGGLLFNLAYCCHQLGQNEKSKKMFYKSYYVYSSMENIQYANLAQAALKEFFQTEITC